MDVYLVFDILSKLAIIAAGAFAAIQLVQIKRQRSRESALQLLNSVQTPELIDAMNIVYGIPLGLTKKEIETHLGEKLPKVMHMHMQLESIGLLVFINELKSPMFQTFENHRL